MTTEQVKEVLHCPIKPLVLLALSYVNLTDAEANTLILRHMRGHTQETVAEELERSKNTIQNWESSGIQKCADAWDKLEIIKAIREACP